MDKPIPQRSAKRESAPGFNYLGNAQKVPSLSFWLLSAKRSLLMQQHSPVHIASIKHLHAVAITTIRQHTKVNVCWKPKWNILSHLTVLLLILRQLRRPEAVKTCSVERRGIRRRSDSRRSRIICNSVISTRTCPFKDRNKHLSCLSPAKYQQNASPCPRISHLSFEFKDFYIYITSYFIWFLTRDPLKQGRFLPEEAAKFSSTSNPESSQRT